MKITLLIAENCPACERARAALSNLTFNGNELSICVTDIADSTINAMPIVPALFVNDKLFSYGDVDTEKLTEYIAGI